MEENFEGLLTTGKLRKCFINRIDEFPCLEEALEEIFLNYPSILCMYDRENDAITFL